MADQVRREPDSGPSPASSSVLCRRDFLQAVGAAGAGLALGPPGTDDRAPQDGSIPELDPIRVATEKFLVVFQDGAMVSLRAVEDELRTEWVQPGQRLGDVVLRYRPPTANGRMRKRAPWNPLGRYPPAATGGNTKPDTPSRDPWVAPWSCG
jgi:hypothetical protein